MSEIDTSPSITLDPFSEGIPGRFELMGAAKQENTALAERLEMNLPGALADAPPTLAFDRIREVNLPWPALVEVMSRNSDGEMSAVSSLRSYFERSWWGEDRPKPSVEHLNALKADGLLVDVSGGGEDKQFLRYAGEGVPGVPVESGVVLRNGLSGRYYSIQTDGSAPAISNPKDYVTFWEKYVDSASMVFTTDEDLVNSQTIFKELDLRAIHIERRFRELKEMERVVRMVSKTAGDALEGIIAQGSNSDLNFEALEAVQARYITIRLNPYRIWRNLRQLKRQAAQMGYLLFLGDEPGMAKSTDAVPDGELPVYKMENTFPDNSKQFVFAGELCTTFRRECTYTVTHQKSVLQNIGEGIGYAFRRFFGGSDAKPKTTWSEKKVKIVTEYKKVDTLTDPLTVQVMKYRAEGCEVYVLNETPSGYVAEDGTALSNVMMRCEYDEDFRRRCVVMLPVFETGFAIDRPIVAYNVFERPVPGIMPTRLPRLFIDETLTYRTAWKHVELGELVSAINLAPGESREINITRSYQEERMTSETRTSISELNSSESTDIATEMESIARTENEFTVHSDYSNETSASAAFEGLGSASASSKFSFGASDTLKTFNQSMNKVAKKAATSISRKNKLDVTTNSTAKTTISTSDSTLIKMSNINEGRSLNLMFYRVYNRYATGLFVENIRFGVTSGVELIAGSGIHETVSFRPDRVKSMLDMLKRTPLPFNNAPSAMAVYQNTILDTVLEQLKMEYLAEGYKVEPPDENTKLQKDDTSAPQSRFEARDTAAIGGSSNSMVIPRELLSLFDKSPEKTVGSKGGPSIAETISPDQLQKRIKKVEEGLSKIEIEPAPLGSKSGGSSDLLIATGGLYMDSMVGVRPSTEPYSEEMRAQEVRKSAAEVLKSEADAQYSLAQARRISQMPVGNNPSHNVLTGVHVLEQYGGRLLTLGFLLPLATGNWTICIDGNPVAGGNIPDVQLNRTSIVLKMPTRNRRAKPHWSEAPDLMQRVTLRDIDTEDEIGPL